jgi:hypothetical protein
MKFKAVTAVTHQTAPILYITPINKRLPVLEKFAAFMWLRGITNQKYSLLPYLWTSGVPREAEPNSEIRGK